MGRVSEAEKQVVYSRIGALGDEIIWRKESLRCPQPSDLAFVLLCTESVVLCWMSLAMAGRMKWFDGMDTWQLVWYQLFADR